jgi:tRNA(His) guanylyltransferase
VSNDDDITATGQPAELSKTQLAKLAKQAKKAKVVVKHVDIIKDTFWEERPWILADPTSR